MDGKIQSRGSAFISLKLFYFYSAEGFRMHESNYHEFCLLSTDNSHIFRAFHCLHVEIIKSFELPL